jgi:hypothetical protein
VRFEQLPAVRAVIVVHRTRPRLYEHLRLAFEQVAHVHVVLDQRLSERRGQPRRFDQDRRRQPRRQPWSKREREAWRSLNVVVVHCH